MAITEGQTEARTTLPSRFREAEARGAELGRGLRSFGRVSDLVEAQLMVRVGAALLERDEPAVALAHASQTRAQQ